MGLIFDRDDGEEQREQQIAQQDHVNNLGNSLPQGGVDPAYVDKVTNSQLEQGTIDLLSNMLSSDWVFSNFSEAEVNETRWLARVMMLQVESLHPNEKSIWTGEFRKAASGNDTQALRPLDSAQRAIIFQFIQGVIARAARSKDGWQQEIFKKQITASERIDPDDDSGNGGWIS